MQRLVVQWHGDQRRTEALLVRRDQTMTHVAWLGQASDLDEVRRTFPTIPIDQRPGAFRSTS